MPPQYSPPSSDDDSPANIAQHTQVSPTGTVVATPRSDSPAITLASSFTSVKLDKGADFSADASHTRPTIPKVGQSDHAPYRVDGFTHLEIEGDLNGQFTRRKSFDPLYKAAPDVKLRPISLSMLKIREDPHATPRKPGHFKKSDYRFADPFANGSIRFTLEDPKFHQGALWKVFKGELSFTPTMPGREYQKVPVVLKLMWLSRFRDAMPRDEMFFEEHHTCDTAWTESLNEDDTLRRLSSFQGGIVPNYYGLYTWTVNTREISRSTPPEVLVMVMEDVGFKDFPSRHRLFQPDEKYVSRRSVLCSPLWIKLI
ncbi:hypothetical protein IAT40_000196 [Kwoniella sp. CBS 6097]